MADDITKLFELTKTGGKGSAVLDWKPSPEVEEFMERIKHYALSESGITDEGGEGIGSLLAAAKAIDKIGKGKSVKTPKFSFSDDDLVKEHIDFWDSGVDFYQYLPIIGRIMKIIQRRVSEN